MQSVVSYKNRGPWGNSSWRGNTSGHIIKDLIEEFSVKHFVDVCEGSGTSRDVAKSLGIKYTGLDLHTGFDFTHDYVLSQLDSEADMVFSHPPYGDMILYKDDARDTSRSKTPEEFCSKSQLMLMNQREATCDGGYYVTLIGDQRKNGEYHSFQSDFIQMMPKNELHSVIIKMQHNMQSNNTKYAGKFIPIVHEHLLIWRKKSRTIVNIGFDLSMSYTKLVASTWRNVLRIIMMKFGTATLEQIYTEVETLAGELISKNKNWQAKIRQKLQVHYQNVSRGVWAL